MTGTHGAHSALMVPKKNSRSSVGFHCATRIGVTEKLSQEANRMQTKPGVNGEFNGQPPRPPLMDIEAVAQRLAVGVRHVRRLVTEKRIPYRKWGHLLRFEPEEIEAWIEATKVPARHVHDREDTPGPY
ncbi:MAG: helix-turn-helix domain-containing protein [Acidimicrobiia bacterium]